VRARMFLASIVPILILGVVSVFFVQIVFKGGRLDFIPMTSSLAGESVVSSALIPILALAGGVSYLFFKIVRNSAVRWKLTWIGAALIKYVKD